jgi:hypothetical protein
MRRTPVMVFFVRSAFDAGNTVAGIYHAGWMQLALAR